MAKRDPQEVPGGLKHEEKNKRFECLPGSPKNVFNIVVENSVEKRESTLVSDSSDAASASCTGSCAGTFVLAVFRAWR